MKIIPPIRQHLLALLGWTSLCLTARAQESTNQTAGIRVQPSFGLNAVEPLQHTLMGYPLWQYLASFLWILLAFVGAAVVDFLMTHQLRRLAARTKTDLDERFLELAHKPVKILIALLLLNVGIHAFSWPPWAELILSALFVLGMAAAVVYLVMKMVDLMVDVVERRFFAEDKHLAKLVLPILGRCFKVFVVVIGGLSAAQYLGLPITSVLAGLGVGGIAVALAAQNTLANFLGTVTILTDRPFHVGDRVQIENFDGVVESIGLRSTRLRTLEGHLVTIPNKTVADSPINNVTVRPTIRQLITVSLTYDTTAEQMQQAVALLREIFTKHPLTHDAWVYWKDYAAHSLDIFVVYWCKSTNYREFLQALEEINLEIKKRFDAAGLEFAFPTQTIYLHQQPQPEPARRVP
jgi:MscS family membrane protein